MSVEDELLQLAREREAATEGALTGMLLEQPDHLRRQLRAYLSRQVDHGRIRHMDERAPRLATLEGSVNELACDTLEFSSGSRLAFKIQLAQEQGGWLVKRFQFHVRIPQPRTINMVRIHLNPQAWHDPLAVPRCHMHIGNSQAHVPFPVMNPRLILHFMCEHIEPDFGA